jgi:acetylornithine deacetylase
LNILFSDPTFKDQVCAYADRRASRLIQIIQDLVRIPSENKPPLGAEAACQQYLARELRNLGLEPDLYSLDEVPGLRQHPLYFDGRNYASRPNLAVRKKGAGGGRSLLLSGHIDTVPRGSESWTHEPFGGEVQGNRLFGRGANDMKGGVATNLFVLEALSEMKLSLAGDLIFESVVDEEFGGSNGTVAGRLRGYVADAAIISEPSFLRVCPAQRGGRTAHILLQASGGVLHEGKLGTGIVDQLSFFLENLKDFAEQRRSQVRTHELYRHHIDPVPVNVTKIVTSPWGTSEPITIPERCQIELYWQTMPGETQTEVEGEFFVWLDSLVNQPNSPFLHRPQVSFPIRWLPGSAISKDAPLVSELAACAAAISGEAPPIVGIEGPCDLYVFQQGFGIPAVLWGAKGANTHGSDEYLEIDSALQAAKTLLLFICMWCA